MKKIIAILALSAALVGPSYATPITEEQKAEFYKICFKISENAALCKCKAEAAPKLIDSEFMAVVIAGMKGKAPAEDQYDAYNEYVGRSNEICKPDY